MAQAKAAAPAVDGWFSLEGQDGEPHLLGDRCTACGTYVFPPTAPFCPNPECDGTEFDRVPLSRRGRVWSYTVNRYQPPPPYVAADPFLPYGLAAVELDDEKLVVLGQVAGDGELPLAVGTEVELVVDTLFEDESTRYLVWKWGQV
jgi:uncharacterized OB-fold protein